jgi:hypothetical protein
MTAQVRIIVEDRKQDVLQIPVQSVVSFSGQYFTYVLAPKGPERRELKVGDANDEFMEVLDGVGEGESVVMSPRTHFSKELSALEAEIAAKTEQNREKLDTPDRKSSGAAIGGGPRGAGADGPPAGGGPGAGGPGGPGGPGAGGPGGGGPPDPKVMFEGMDKNKDGVVTKDEHPRPEFFDRSDKDGDGKLTLEEMQAAFRERMQQGQGRPQ